jgi:hypothetical protein
MFQNRVHLTLCCNSMGIAGYVSIYSCPAIPIEEYSAAGC